MKKKSVIALGNQVFLLGKDSNGILYWLEESSWVCDWYWGIGYVETYTNNKQPQLAKDISSHQHFSMFLNDPGKNGYDAFKDFFVETPLSNEEIWKLIELMKTAYIAREWSDTIHRGGSHYTSNPCEILIKNDEEYDRINRIVIPNVMQAVYSLLSPSETNKN